MSDIVAHTAYWRIDYGCQGQEMTYRKPKSYFPLILYYFALASYVVVTKPEEIIAGESFTVIRTENDLLDYVL